jgi:hypothetical protein
VALRWRSSAIWFEREICCAVPRGAFDTSELVARARCIVAEAEISLVLRDLGAMRKLGPARVTLEAHGDRANAAHAGYLQARWFLLVGRLEDAAKTLNGLDLGARPSVSRPGAWLVAAGLAMRRIEAVPARAALGRAAQAARETGIPLLLAEVEKASHVFDAPVARLRAQSKEQLLGIAEVESLIASETFLVDACRNAIRVGATIVPLGSRPVLFTLVRALAEAWPKDVSREALLSRAFRAREADESHRARLRVEISRLRTELRQLADVRATEAGFVLQPYAATAVAVLQPPQEDDHADVLALLADGEAWSSSALALALDVSTRTAQRALEALAEVGKIESFGRGRSHRWVIRQMPGFPTNLLLPAVPQLG